MGWFSWLKEDTKSFEQDLELLIARWTNRARKDGDWRSKKEVGESLLERAEQLLEEDMHEKRNKRK